MATETEAWCETCGSWAEEGECPTCGQILVEDEPPPIPWHFKFLVVAIVAYLGWRAVQAIFWLVGRF